MRLDQNGDILYDDSDESESEEQIIYNNNTMNKTTINYIIIGIVCIILGFVINYSIQDHGIQDNIKIIENLRKDSQGIDQEIKDLYLQINDKKKLIKENMNKANESKKVLLDKYGIIFK